MRVFSGGMIRGERRGQLGDVAAYIRWAFKDVEARTGVEFGRDFIDGPLQHGKLYMTSEPPAQLLAWLREQDGVDELRAAHALQEALYDKGLGPATPEYARSVAATLGVDADAAEAVLTDPNYMTQALADFAFVEQLGVRGFPALFLHKDDVLRGVVNGYANADSLRQQLRQAQTPLTA